MVKAESWKEIHSTYQLWDTTIWVDVKLVMKLHLANVGKNIVQTMVEIQAWIRRDAYALSSIVYGVSDSVMALI